LRTFNKLFAAALVAAIAITPFATDAASAKPVVGAAASKSLAQASSKKPAKAPVRIISLSPSATEILWGIGAAKQVAAVDDNSNFPAGVPTSKLSSFTPNVEAIAAYNPDLVILQANATKATEVQAALKKLGIAVYLEQTPNNTAGAYTEFQQLGALTGHASQASRLVATMRKQIKGIVSLFAAPHIRVFHELDNTLYSAASKTFIGAVYKDFGVTNIADAASGADKTGYPQLSAEYLIKANPQVVVLADGDWGETKATVSERAGWSAIDAVKNGKVFTIGSDISSRWGPRLVDLYRAVGNIIAKVN